MDRLQFVRSINDNTNINYLYYNQLMIAYDIVSNFNNTITSYIPCPEGIEVKFSFIEKEDFEMVCRKLSSSAYLSPIHIYGEVYNVHTIYAENGTIIIQILHI